MNKSTLVILFLFLFACKVAYSQHADLNYYNDGSTLYDNNQNDIILAFNDVNTYEVNGASSSKLVREQRKHKDKIYNPRGKIFIPWWYSMKKNPLFAIKTNLLYCAASVVNAEIEVPIGQRWSVATDWMFPWWTLDDGTTESGRHRIQALHGTVTGKYWFGDRSICPVLTGWHAGIYTGGGLYDFEYKKRGVQGDFFIAGGLTGGYAHTISKYGNLRMEYSIGVGFLKTKYCTYTAEYYGKDDWRAIRRERGVYTWIGPTQAKVSLVWMFSYMSKNKGRK